MLKKCININSYEEDGIFLSSTAHPKKYSSVFI